MAIAIVFLLGIANFACHRAVLASGHPLVRQFLGRGGVMRPEVTLALEFVILLVALLVVANGHTGWGWAYALYSIGNGVSAWVILTNRI
ncbi:hypothetical protein [Alteraurantiacibacter aquimixticola]|uniref:DUF3784 domain-containing protein n=1 Tax=Alteraurantiacibacter aquimixticola TaxID=2489173 RepID=A0A4T3EZV9_9SPHN|nr:hypothetical protein [Alteraurantiacibacter aquimixticola]TIX49124.1 hypothetical protein E5222_15490 [Alteraurantiacibacter aquimixticola]